MRYSYVAVKTATWQQWTPPPTALWSAGSSTSRLLPHTRRITSLSNHTLFAHYSIYNPYSLIAMLFTRTLVLSRPFGKEGFERETWVVGVNSKILGGPKQIRRMLMEQSSKSLNLTLDWGHEGRICKVLQEDGRSSMYKLWLRDYAIERNCRKLFVACYP
jgi:hypothetical protein